MANSPLRGVYRDSAGNAVASPTVNVYEAGTTTPITIFSDRAGAALDNPFTGDADGEWEFYAAEGQEVRVTVEKSGFDTWDKDWISIGPAGAVDHGGLSGLADNDHPQYLLLDATNDPVTGDLRLSQDLHVDGAVGIGTATPAVELTVVGRIDVERSSSPRINLNDTGASQVWQIIAIASNSTFRFRDATANTSPFTIEKASPDNSLFIRSQGLALWGAGSFGGGVGVISLLNATTAPTSNPSNGVILYSDDVSASARLKLRDEAGLAPTIGGVIFTQTADQTVTNTTTETTIFGSGIGSRTLPANSLTVGRTLKVKISGIYSTPAIGSPNLTVRVKIGGTTIASGTTTAIATSSTDLRFVGELLITCRSVGATGSVVVDGGINYNIPGSNEPVSDPLNNAGAATTIDTTASNDFDVTVQWDSASASREAVSTVATVEVLN